DCLRVGREIQVVEGECGEDFQRFHLKGVYGNHYDLEIKLRGIHQLENAAAAFGLAKSLEDKTRLKVSPEAVRDGLAQARWPGRLEKISESIKIVLDGAHNADSALRMMDGIKRHFRYSDLIVVLGVSQDKDLAGILRQILPEAGCLIATQAAHPRAMDARQIARQAEMFGADKEIFVEADVKTALEKAKFLADASDLILVTGSLFLVADVKRLV
ncbi:MAG: cyanophycin synthetase, partial [Candidatus Omnitrophota bacterium]